MLSEHDEIEAKLAADHVPFEDFKQFAMKTFAVTEFLKIKGPDHYLKNGTAVVAVASIVPIAATS